MNKDINSYIFLYRRDEVGEIFDEVEELDSDNWTKKWHNCGRLGQWSRYQNEHFPH